MVTNFYKMSFDMDMIDKAILEGNPFIYAETCNIDDIEVEGIKQGFFDRIILRNNMNISWPNVIFYYSSKASRRESDYLVNIKGWPLIHKNVMNELKENQVEGITFYPIQLVDVCTNEINDNYYLMYINNFINAFDMEKSQYKYNQKYDLYTFIPKKTYLNKDNCKGHDLFRADKSVSDIYVSEKIKNLIERNNFVGFTFTVQE